MARENKTYNLETMAGVGKTLKLAGREYEVLPVNIEDMHYILGENPDERIHILTKESVEKGEVSYMTFGLNLQGKTREIFLKIINKYVYYLKQPMTEKLLIEHNWSFKEIAHFLWFWVQEVSE